MNNLVSIIIPTYNRADMLPGAVESCLNQTYSEIEVIIVDDGSTDNTEEVVKPLLEKDSRVKYFKKKNGKLPKALNYGFKRAKGDYLTWTSDDNRYLPTAIEEMVKKQQEFGKDCLVYADYNWKSKVTGEEKTVSCKNPEDIERFNNIGACFLYTRNIMEAVGNYDSKKFLIEDYDYWLRIYKKFPVVHLEKVLYEYLEHKTTLTHTRMPEIQMLALYLQKVHKVYKGKRFYRKYRQKLLKFLMSLPKGTLGQKTYIIKRFFIEVFRLLSC